MNRIKHRFSVLIVAGLLVACGGGDDDSADSDGDDTEQPGDDAPADAGDGDTSGGDDSSDGGGDSGGDTGGDSNDSDGGGGDGDSDGTDNDDDVDITEPMEDDDMDDGDDDTIVISDFDDIPGECIDLMGAFLRDIEPIVADVDWANATIADLEDFGTDLDVPIEDFDVRAAETGCDRFEIGADDGQSLDFAIEVAQREAPGAVGWLQFIAGMSSLGDTVDDVVDPTDPDDGSAADLDTCEAVKAFLIGKAAEYGTISQVPVSEVMELTTIISEATQVCTIAEFEELTNDPTILAFLDG